MSKERELLDNVEDFDDLAAKEQTEVLLYILLATTDQQSGTGTDLEAMRTRLGLAKGRSAQHLANHANKRSGNCFAKRSRGYSLSRSRREHWSGLIQGRSATVRVTNELRTHLETLPEGVLRDYLYEAVGCFEARHLRATVLMAWCAGFYVFRNWLHTHELGALNAQMATWKKAKTITSIDEFDELSERVVIDTSREAKIISKATHKVLVALLDQRNSYAHPSGRSISDSVTEAFVQQVIDEIIAKFL